MYGPRVIYLPPPVVVQSPPPVATEVLPAPRPLPNPDPNAPPVNICTDCHARADTKPKLLPEIPKLKFEGSTEETILTNQQAMHRTCGVCHDAVVKARPDLTPAPPTSKKCVACHKKVVA